MIRVRITGYGSNGEQCYSQTEEYRDFKTLARCIGIDLAEDLMQSDYAEEFNEEEKVLYNYELLWNDAMEEKN